MPQTLTDDGNKSKSAIIRFFDFLDEATGRHQLARALHDDDEARDQVSEEVVKLIVSSLQKSIQKNIGKELSQSEYCLSTMVSPPPLTCNPPFPRPKTVRRARSGDVPT